MAKKGLKEWLDEKWVDIGAPKKDGKYQPCGRQKGSKRKYPKCVPLAKATRMTKSQKASAVRRKRAAGNPGGKPTNVARAREKTVKARLAVERQRRDERNKSEAAETETGLMAKAQSEFAKQVKAERADVGRLGEAVIRRRAAANAIPRIF